MLVFIIGNGDENGSKIFGIVGRDGGYTKESSDLVMVVPTIDESLVTPHTEGWQAVIWHLLVSHPKLNNQILFQILRLNILRVKQEKLLII